VRHLGRRGNDETRLADRGLHRGHRNPEQSLRGV